MQPDERKGSVSGIDEMAWPGALAYGPAPDWPHQRLYNNVVRTLFALPDGFRTSLRISDFRATDIFTLNAALGASIEGAVVDGLNGRWEAWDTEGEYMLWRFERQAQAFPDVRLVKGEGNEQEVLFGIELKGWFALSKAGEPTFRYTVNPEVCAPADLLVVFPWVLSDVVAGSPKLMRPFVWPAREIAEKRNSYWREMRQMRGRNGTIILASHREPYPAVKTDQCADRAEDDAGNNFGRVARYGLLDEFVKATRKQEVSGIPVAAWLTFFRHFSDTKGDLEAVVEVIAKQLGRTFPSDEAGEERILAEHANYLEKITAILRME